jgi:FkbM family methyltransferase
VDVGANRGTWTRAAFRYFPNAVYTLVEPQDHLRSYSQDLIAQGCKLKWINAGCGDFSGTLPLFVSYRDDASTFVDWHEGWPRITVPIMTLNEVVAFSGAGLPEMVKIDAEGFDLKVLAGLPIFWVRLTSFWSRRSCVPSVAPMRTQSRKS